MTAVETSASPDARRIWRAARAPALILALIVAAGIVVALLRGSSEGGALDPRSAEPNGSRALARLLDDQGVRVELVHTAADARQALAGGGTLLVTNPALLEPDDLERIGADAAELVLVAPELDVARAVVPDVRIDGHPAEEVRRPHCTLDAARAAGPATAGGVSYRADGRRCYPAAGGATLLRVSGNGRGVTLVGTGAPLTNEALADEGNAALAMRLLGMRERLVWYVPSPADPGLGRGDKSLAELLPVGWKFGLVQLAIAVALFALWRVRRLGPVVTEPLPVVVHAAETTEGRARLYRKARAADHAAEGLRAAARFRIATRLGLTADAEPDAVVNAAAARTGRRTDEVRALLYGPAPPDDAALVRIADALDSFENEVRSR